MKLPINLASLAFSSSPEPVEALDCITWLQVPRLKFYLATGYRLENLDLERGRIGSSNFREVDMINVNFKYAFLTRCTFDTCWIADTSFRYAEMPATIFYRTSFRNCDFTGMECFGNNTYFISCHFYDCDFHDASLDGRNFVKCSFCGCVFGIRHMLEGFTAGNFFNDCRDMPYLPMICPDEGSFIGFKQAHATCTESGNTGGCPCIVKMCVPAHARRSSGSSRKCRCSEALILDAWDLNGTPIDRRSVISSNHDPDFKYKIGDSIHIDDFDENRWNECSAGFHFFMNEEEARNYC